MMRIFSVISILVIACCLFQASVCLGGKLYKWVDENGVVHFSDRKPERPDQCYLGQVGGVGPWPMVPGPAGNRANGTRAGWDPGQWDPAQVRPELVGPGAGWEPGQWDPGWTRARWARG